MSKDKIIQIKIRQFRNNLISYLQKNRVFNSFFNTPLWKAVLILGTGTIFSQILNILTIPILTRLYSPSDFGLLGIFSAVLTIIMTFISFRYEYAIPVPKDSETAAHLLVLCISLICLTSLVLSILLILFGSYFATTFNLQTLAPFFWLLLIGCFGAGLYQALNYWAVRKRDYTTITYTQISQSVSGNLSKLFFGILGIGSIGLLIGQVISNVTGVGSFVKRIRLADRKSFSSISFSGLKHVAREYRDFPIFSVPANLILQLSLQFPIFFISLYYGVEEVGWYTLANQMLALPSYVIGNSVSQAFYGEAAKQMNTNPYELKALFLNTVKKLTLISLPIFVSIALLAPFIFPIIFGESWKGAGLYTLPLAIVALSKFISNPTNNLAIYGFNKWLFGFQIFRFILIFIGFYISYVFNLNILLSLFLYSCIVAFTYFLLIYLNVLAIDKLILNHSKIS